MKMLDANVAECVSSEKHSATKGGAVAASLRKHHAFCAAFISGRHADISILRVSWLKFYPDNLLLTTPQ
jgi:hypothetical protein